MKLSTIIEIAEDAIIADLCVKWYYLNEKTDEDSIKEKEDVFNKIQELYKKINENNKSKNKI